MVLFYFEDRPASEAAEILQISPGAARVALHRIRVRLADVLNEEVRDERVRAVSTPGCARPWSGAPWTSGTSTPRRRCGRSSAGRCVVRVGCTSRTPPARALASAAAVFAIGILGSGSPSRQPEPAAPTSLTGSWQRTVDGAEQWSGDWSLTFAAGDVLELSTPVGLSPEEGTADGASYAFDDDTLRLDAFSNGVCLDQRVGSYRFTLDGDRLFLEAVDDPCQQRREVFTGVWQPGT